MFCDQTSEERGTDDSPGRARKGRWAWLARADGVCPYRQGASEQGPDGRPVLDVHGHQRAAAGAHATPARVPAAGHAELVALLPAGHLAAGVRRHEGPRLQRATHLLLQVGDSH